MTHGLVFGKFYPLHKGHLALIAYALHHCDRLTVLVCASDTESISGALRQQWLETCLTNQSKVTIQLLNYDEKILPNTSVSSRETSQIWAIKFQELLPDVNLLCTSEPYGTYLAEFMHIRHLPFDPTRSNVPISASQIRKHPLTHWEYLPPEVQPYFVKKVVIVGTESTGKTTLAENLAAHFHTCFVREMGRELIPDSTACSLNDLYAVAEAQANEILQMMPLANRLLFIDTDIHITMSYARFLFDHEFAVHESVLQANKADAYLYLNHSAPYIQDGTRLDHATRNALDSSHQQVLKEAGVSYKSISGNWKERFDKAVALTNALLNQQTPFVFE